MKAFFKHLVAIMIIAFLISGCAAGYLSTKIAGHIGDGIKKSAAIGVPKMKEAVKDWPYMSGQIKGIPEYRKTVPVAAQDVVDRLDRYAQKTEELTAEECGTASTDLVNIEKMAIEFGWDKYGVSVTAWLRTYFGM